MNDLMKRIVGIHDSIADAAEAGRAERGYAVGYVMCKSCGRLQKQAMADGLKNGWPKCCGKTMSIDVPLAALQEAEG